MDPNLFGLKFFRTWNFIRPKKNLDLKSFQTQIFFFRTITFVEATISLIANFFWLKNFFGVQNSFLAQTFFWPPNFFEFQLYLNLNLLGFKILLDPKNCQTRPIFFFGPTICFELQSFLDPKCFIDQLFLWTKTFLDLTIFLDQLFFPDLIFFGNWRSLSKLRTLDLTLEFIKQIGKYKPC